MAARARVEVQLATHPRPGQHSHTTPKVPSPSRFNRSNSATFRHEPARTRGDTSFLSPDQGEVSTTGPAEAFDRFDGVSPRRSAMFLCSAHDASHSRTRWSAAFTARARALAHPRHDAVATAPAALQPFGRCIVHWQGLSGEMGQTQHSSLWIVVQVFDPGRCRVCLCLWLCSECVWPWGEYSANITHGFAGNNALRCCGFCCLWWGCEAAVYMCF